MGLSSAERLKKKRLMRVLRCQAYFPLKMRPLPSIFLSQMEIYILLDLGREWIASGSWDLGACLRVPVGVT